MDEIRTTVMTLLTRFRENQRNIELLRYELEHPPMVTEDEMIDALTYGHRENIGSATGNVSDKTYYTSLNYKERTKSSMNEAVHDILIELSRLETQQQRLLHYISLMDEQDSAIIHMTYMDALDTEQIATEMGVSERTVRTRRATAIDHLCRMFEYTVNLQHDGMAK